MAAQYNVCVIGAGPQGLAALKNLLELNDPEHDRILFNAEILESRENIGGIWAFSENRLDVTALRNTIQNTSRFRNCYSDFPVKDAWNYGGRPDSPPLYLSQEDSAFYLEQYAKRFELHKNIRFEHRVLALERDVKTSHWLVKVLDGRSGDQQVKSYDKVIVATGQHHSPMIPSIEGLHLFEGEVLHAANFKSKQLYTGKTVLIVGSSNSAGDVATELAGAAKQVLISRRRGVLISPRITRGRHRPNDVALTRRLDAIMWIVSSFAPAYMAAFIAKAMANMIAKGWGDRLKPEWNLKSDDAASISFQAPMVSDTIVPLLEAGKVQFVEGVRRILSNGSIKLQDETEITADTIIFCTGYSMDSTLSSVVQRSGELQLPRLYQNIYHPQYADSLVYLTSWFTIAGIYEIGDLAAMGIAQVFAGRYRLPDCSAMEKYINSSHAFVYALAARVPKPISLQSAARCVDRGPWLRFLHEAAGTDVQSKLGYGFKGWKFWWSDRDFCHLLMTGISSIHVSRLFDGRPRSRKKWSGARQAIIDANGDLRRIEIERREQDGANKDKVA